MSDKDKGFFIMIGVALFVFFLLTAVEWWYYQ